MITPSYLLICIYSILQLCFLLVLESKRRDSHPGQEHFFKWMLVIGISAFIANILSSLPTKPSWVFVLSASGNYLEMILSTSLIPIFFLFICEQIPDLSIKVKQLLTKILVALSVICSLIIVSTGFNGQIFYFDDRLIYHRGPLFLVPMILQLVMMGMGEGFLISQKKKMIRQEYYVLVFFLAAPLIGWALQSVIFGLPFALCGITFAAQVVYSTIQSRHIDKDYLTGAFNRLALDRYVKSMMSKKNSKHAGFAIILLDLDNFKSINDCYGHYEGDMALIQTVALLRKAVHNEDYVARYGGDEFCIVMNSGNAEAAEKAIQRIRDQFLATEKQLRKPYRINCSIGYAVYHKSMGEDISAIYKIVDHNMYLEKMAHRDAC